MQEVFGDNSKGTVSYEQVVHRHMAVYKVCLKEAFGVVDQMNNWIIEHFAEDHPEDPSRRNVGDDDEEGEEDEPPTFFNNIDAVKIASTVYEKVVSELLFKGAIQSTAPRTRKVNIHKDEKSQ